MNTDGGLADGQVRMSIGSESSSYPPSHLTRQSQLTMEELLKLAELVGSHLYNACGGEAASITRIATARITFKRSLLTKSKQPVR